MKHVSVLSVSELESHDLGAIEVLFYIIIMYHHHWYIRLYIE